MEIIFHRVIGALLIVVALFNLLFMYGFISLGISDQKKLEYTKKRLFGSTFSKLYPYIVIMLGIILLLKDWVLP